MNIQFQHPSNGFTNFNPSDVNNYSNLNLPGIYIYGLRQTIKGIRGKTFIPLYVGITENLKKRLYNDHFLQESWPGKKSSLKEIFDFSNKVYSLKDIADRYRDMLIYDLVTNCGGKQRPIISYLKHLVWFQDLTFFNQKIGANIFPLPITNSNHLDSYKNGLLASMKNNSLDVIITKGELTKKKFNNDFYFVYATYQDIINSNNVIDLKNSKLSSNYNKESAEKIELRTKKVLNQLGINTTAKANGMDIQIKIDLSLIQNDLINLTGKPFINPLIL
jgi:hypothetical protein